MDVIRSAIARARLRMLAQATLHWWGWLLLVAAGVSVLLVLAERLTGLNFSLGVYLGFMAAALIAGPVVAWMRRPSEQHIAAVLDEQLGLKDRLGTALFARNLGNDPLARHVVSDAEHAARELRIADATPVGFGRVWAAAPAVGAVAIALAMGLPDYDLLGIEARERQRQAQQQEAEAEEQRLAEAQSRIREMTAGQRPNETADPDDVMRQLASLTEHDLSNPDVRREMRSRLEDVRDRLDEAAEQQERQLQTLRNAMSQLETQERGPADQFADAMRRGDFNQAQQELDRLAQQHEDGQMSETEQQRLQHQFEEMAEQLQQMGEQAQQQHEQTREHMREQLRQQDLDDEKIDELEQQDYDRDAVKEALEEQYREQGMDEQQAQERAEQQAEQTRQQQQESQRQQQTAEQCQGFGQCMGGMAGSLGQQGQQGGQGQQGSQFQQQSWEAQQQLERMKEQEGELQRLAQAREQLQEAQDAMDGQQPGDTGDSPGQGQQQADAGEGDGQGAMQQRADGGGVGGQEGGTGATDTPLGDARQPHDYETTVEHAPRPGRGRVIASWMSEGEADTGESRLEFNQAVTEARDEADRAVAEDRVPRRYHGSIRSYFEQLPESVEEDE